MSTEDIMEEEEGEIEVGEDIKKNGNGKEDAAVILVTEMYRTPKSRMLEMTNLPLDKHRTITWMKVYVKEGIALCRDIVDAQEILSARYAKYHDGKRPEVNWGNWEDIRKKIISLVDTWVFHYCQVRRSKDGEHVKNAVVLAQDQMAAQQQGEGESAFDQLRDQ